MGHDQFFGVGGQIFHDRAEGLGHIAQFFRGLARCFAFLQGLQGGGSGAPEPFHEGGGVGCQGLEIGQLGLLLVNDGLRHSHPPFGCYIVQL